MCITGYTRGRKRQKGGRPTDRPRADILYVQYWINKGNVWQVHLIVFHTAPHRDIDSVRETTFLVLWVVMRVCKRGKKSILRMCPEQKKGVVGKLEDGGVCWGKTRSDDDDDQAERERTWKRKKRNLPRKKKRNISNLLKRKKKKTEGDFWLMATLRKKN